MLFSIFLISCCFISACGYLIRGGSTKILNGPVKNGRFIGCIVSVFAFEVLAIYLNLSVWMVLAYGIGWYLTVLSSWQPWFSIGQSTSPKRDEGYIGEILHPIFGVPVPATWSASRRVAYDSCGMFIRMLDSLPLFITIAMLINFSWYSLFVGTVFSCTFAALIVFIYGGYNWFVPSKYRTDKNLNLSEFASGWFIFQLVLAEITCLIATISAK